MLHESLDNFCAREYLMDVDQKLLLDMILDCC